MRVPVGLKVALLVVATTAFYTYLGQLVPQKEVSAPVVIELSQDLTTADLIDIGASIADGKGLCLTCHTIGKTGALRFPDLAGIGARAGNRIEGFSDLDYLAQSLYEPDVYIVEGYNPGMPKINKAPIGLTDDEILAVMAWLQSLGGDPTVDMQTVHSYNEGS